MIIFRYSRKIDKECWNRIINAKIMFGHQFPSSFSIKKENIKEAKRKVKYFQKIWRWHEVDFRKGIRKIFRHNFPSKMVCYINTSNYSMDNFDKGYISISFKRETSTQVISSIAHESSHFMYKKYYGRDENIKEVITIINNVEIKGVEDRGWEIFEKERIKALKVWKRTKDIREVIKNINLRV